MLGLQLDSVFSNLDDSVILSPDHINHKLCSVLLENRCVEAECNSFVLGEPLTNLKARAFERLPPVPVEWLVFQLRFFFTSVFESEC